MRKIGFIDVGMMGKPMAKNLTDARYDLVVNDINQDAVKEVVEYGAEEAHSPREVAEKLGEKGVRCLDAPVSGGEPGAIKGTLAIMVGGPEDVFDECREILEMMQALKIEGHGGADHGGIALFYEKIANERIESGNV